MASNKHRVEIRPGVTSAQFTAEDGRHIELDSSNSTFETANEYFAADLVASHPGLKAAGKKE